MAEEQKKSDKLPALGSQEDGVKTALFWKWRIGTPDFELEDAWRSDKTDLKTRLAAGEVKYP